jgi:hypothetical protein
MSSVRLIRSSFDLLRANSEKFGLLAGNMKLGTQNED